LVQHSDTVQPEVPDSIRVVLADRHTMVREGLRRLLDDEEDLRVIAEAGGADDVIALVRRLNPDVLVLSSGSGNWDARSLLQALSTLARPAPKTVVLSANGVESLDDLIALGAAGAIAKTASIRELITAIRQIAGGATYLRPGEAEPAATEDSLRGEEPTSRELDVLRLLAEGLSNRDIGLRLGIGEATVRYHMGHIFMKLRARSRTQALYLARQRGWLS